DPARRVGALNRILNVARRILAAAASGTADAERSIASRDSWKRNPEPGHPATQIAPRSSSAGPGGAGSGGAGARALDQPPPRIAVFEPGSAPRSGTVVSPELPRVPRSSSGADLPRSTRNASDSASPRATDSTGGRGNVVTPIRA